MWPTFVKEITGFFSTLTGYIAGIVFLLLTGLQIFVLPGVHNVLDTGQATLSTLFAVAPWFFLFLIPAITMRMFADERREGTLELMLTRPVSEISIVLGKYFAALVVVLIMLLPTMVYYTSIWRLGSPVGSIDSGATWGSYLGLFLLAAVYASIGTFCSSFTSNSIIAFVLAALISLFLYVGFAQMAGLSFFRPISHQLATLGIQEHYHSISRGVIDSRDLLYFFSIIVLALFGSKAMLTRLRS